MHNSQFSFRKTVFNRLVTALALVLMAMLPSKSLHAQFCPVGDTLYVNHTGSVPNPNTSVVFVDLVVPPGVDTLHIYARGADGGYAGSSPATGRPGTGAVIEADFIVTPGDTLRVFAGNSGYGHTFMTAGGGGGGASAVINISQGNIPLLVAGGGGGAGSDEEPFFTGGNSPLAGSLDGKGASIGLNGTSSANGHPGGVGGAGGTGGSLAGGGGGFNSRGTPIQHGGLQASPQGAIGGFCCPVNKRHGGAGYISGGSPVSESDLTGGGGGGGGYSGGGGGSSASGGGGGGSFVAANALNVVMTPGIDGQTGLLYSGQVTICGPPPVLSPPASVPTLSEWGLIILGLLIICIGAIAVFNMSKATAIEN